MEMKKIIMICAVLMLFPGLLHKKAHGELPVDFPDIIVTTHDANAVADGYVFLAIASETPGIGTYLMILDNDGNAVWYQKIDTHEIYDFKVIPNGLLSYAPFIHAHSYTGGGDATHEIRDDNYNLVETITGGNGYVAESHDFQILPNGNILQFGYYMTEVDMSQIVNGGNPAALVSGGVVQELDAERNVVFQWRTWDFHAFDDENQSWRRATGKYVSKYHLNTINQDPDGHIILGTPTEVIKLNRQTGEVVWTLPDDFTLIGDNADESHFGGHATYRIDNGNFLMYDNGGRKGQATSMVHEYTLDEEAMTATHVWSWVPPVNIGGWHRGNAQRLPNGNTFIGWGGAGDNHIPPCTEVTPDGDVVFELYFEPNETTQIESYRAFRFPYPPSTQAVEYTEYELATGNTYDFENTGVSLKIISGGGGYNEVTVTREPYAPVYPEFPGKAPRVLPVRVKIDEYHINNMAAEVSFDSDSFNLENSLFFDNPDDLTIYFRPIPGRGLFIPLSTNYNPVQKKLRATMNQFGEFILCYNDVEDMPYEPILCKTENYRGVQEYMVIAPPKAEPNTIYTVNQELPVLLSWSPKGFARSYELQVSKDSDFSTTDIDESYLTEARYILETAESNTTYYYRVRTNNEGGTSGWSSGSFMTIPPMIEVTIPNGGENWQRGQEYFIRWNDNITENVVIELYKGDSLIETIGTVPSDRAHEWEIDMTLEPGSDYSIKIKNANDESITDSSDATFSIQ